jgi:hypothetical protein
MISTRKLQPRNIVACRQLLGGDRETDDCTSVVRQRPTKNTEEWCFLCGSISNNLTATQERCFMRSAPKSYKQYNRSNELAVRQSPAGKNISMEAENIVGIRHQATMCGDTADSKDSLRAVVNCIVCELAIALYLLVVTMCSINSITNPNPVYSHTHTRDNINRQSFLISPHRPNH